MRVLIVAKTRRGTGACVGGITQHGESVRLVAGDAAHNEHAGLEYQVGDVWEIEADPDLALIPPHVENIIVHSARFLKRADNLESVIHRFLPPAEGGPEKLFDGHLQALPSGALYIAERTGLPAHSTQFWKPDQPLQMDVEGKRIRYRYPTTDGGRTLTFVGFQDPVEVIAPGTLLRVSLAHWWRPRDAPPDEELRCHVQLSGWFPVHLSSSCSSSSLVLGHATDSTQAHSLLEGGSAVNSPEAGPRQIPPRTRPGLEAMEVRVPAAPRPDLSRARQLLKQVFGFSDFQSLQADIIARLLERKDTLVVMPTGGGKSLCYQLPALLFEGLTVVVSPLIALMQDQVSQLRLLAVQAAFLNSTLSNAEYVAIAHRVRQGNVRILYVAPETLTRPELLVLLEQSRLTCLAVDEAHCISEWGHDFRPDYRQIQEVRRHFPGAVCVALTATATPRVRRDILTLLGIPEAGAFQASFNRPNLFLAVQVRRDGLSQTLAFLGRHRGQSGIIYCSTRKQVDLLAGELRARGWPALAYHAGMAAESRRQNQDAFIRDDATIMVATVAFGMGINKSNVRFVLHYHLPKDIESYYQEIGRAGRDGLPANCLLLHSRADAVTIRRFIDEGAASERAGRSARLDALMRYAESAGCRRGPLLAYFGETQPAPCGHCDNCQAKPPTGELTDVTEAARKFFTCVQRTGECFGPAHVIEVLRGSRAKRVVQRGHDQLPVHGTGRDFPAETWRELARQFIEQGWLEQDLQHGGVHLTAKGREVLAGGEVKLRLEAALAPVALEETHPAEQDAELFERLRALRRDCAARTGVPAYMVFSDRTLLEMSQRLPRTREQLLAINGVGEAKLAAYGDAFLAVMRDHGPAQPTAAGVSEGAASSTGWLTARRRHEEVGEAFAAGQSLQVLASQLGIKRATVVQHLTRFVQEGGRLAPERLAAELRLSVPERQRVREVFDKLGTDHLGPVHEALQGAIPYEELHLLRLWVKCR